MINPAQVDPTIKDYEIFISNLAAGGEDKVFLNSSAVHAAIVMKTLFKHSKKDVMVYAYNLNGEVSKDKAYQNEVRSFLERGGNLSVLVEDANSCVEGEMFQIINHYRFFHPDRVKVRASKVSIVDSITDNNLSKETQIHFTISDDKGYRKEVDINNFLAQGNFNDPIEVQKLSSIFNTIFSSNEYSEPCLK